MVVEVIVVLVGNGSDGGGDGVMRIDLVVVVRDDDDDNGDDDDGGACNGLVKMMMGENVQVLLRRHTTITLVIKNFNFFPIKTFFRTGSLQNEEINKRRRRTFEGDCTFQGGGVCS